MIETISKIWGGDSSNYLQRIFLSTKLQNHLKKIHQDPVKIIIKNKTITLSCRGAAQASFFRLRRRRLYGEMANILGKGHGYKIVVRVRSN